jgi:hypothetical protein
MSQVTIYSFYVGRLFSFHFLIVVRYATGISTDDRPFHFRVESPESSFESHVDGQLRHSIEEDVIQKLYCYDKCHQCSEVVVGLPILDLVLDVVIVATIPIISAKSLVLAPYSNILYLLYRDSRKNAGQL